MSEKDTQEELTIVEVPTLPTPEEIAAREAPQDDGADDQHDDDDDGDSGDERLSADQRDEGDADGGKEKKRKTTAEKRRIQREARDRTLQRLDSVLADNAEMARRLLALESVTVATQKSTLDDRLGAARTRLEEAEYVMAKAIEAGNGEDATKAIRARDEARDELRDIEARKQQLDRPPERPAGGGAAESLKAEWLRANASWYDGQNEESLITNAIDAAVKRDGFNENTPAYWEELTRRVKNRLAPEVSQPERKRETAPRRDGPPVGATREHAPASTRREVYVTPERKQAMQEAGIWDDPVRRKKMLETYAAYDRDRRA